MGLVDKGLSLRNRGRLLVGVFEDEDHVMAATKALRSKGTDILDIYTPYPIHGLEVALGVKRSNLSVVAFLCGMTGFSLVILMIWYMYVHDWPMIIGNKPVRFTTSWVPILFEGTVLCTAFGMGIIFFLRNRMLHGIQPEILDDRQTDDRMVIVVEADNNVDEATMLKTMKEAGAVELRERIGGVQTVL